MPSPGMSALQDHGACVSVVQALPLHLGPCGGPPGSGLAGPGGHGSSAGSAGPQFSQGELSVGEGWEVPPAFLGVLGFPRQLPTHKDTLLTLVWHLLSPGLGSTWSP